MHSRVPLAVGESSPPTGGQRALPTLLERPLPWVLASGIVLCLGIVVSALSTTDPMWWVLYFSHLGTFGDLSSHVFNAGLILCGAIVVFSAIPVRLFIERALEAGAIADVRTRHVLPPIVLVMGVSLSMIGVVPVSTNEFLHDRAANGVLLSFLAMVVACRIMLPEIPPALHRWAVIGVTTLIVGIIAMITGVINLTLFEVIAFGTILTWVQLIQSALARIAVQPGRDEDAAELVEQATPELRRAYTPAHRPGCAATTSQRATRRRILHRAPTRAPSRPRNSRSVSRWRPPRAAVH